MTWAEATGAVPEAGGTGEERAAGALLDALWDAPVGIAVVGRDERWVALNPAFGRMVGEPIGQHVGHPALEWLGPAGLVREDALQRALAGGAATSGLAVSGEWPPGSGDVRTWLTSYHPILGRSGAIGAALVVTDVTEARRSEDAHRRDRREEERALQALIRLQAITAALAAATTPADVAKVALEEGVGLVDASAGSISWAVAPGELEILDALGYPERALVAWRRYGADLPAPLAEAFRTGEPVWIESPAGYAARYPAIEGAGRLFPDGASAAVPLVVQGAVVGVLGLDFAEPAVLEAADRSIIQALAQHSAEAFARARLYEEQARLRADAERSAAVLDTLFSSVPIGLAFVDWDLRLQHANAAWARFYCISPEACVGRTVTELVPGDAGRERARIWRRILASGEPVVEVELTGTGPDEPDAARAWLESWYPVVAGGQTIGLGLVARDITDLKRADAFRRNVLGVVGHDLRNPLSAILGYARLLSRDANLDARQRGMLAKIEASTGKADRIVRDLLDLTRVETARAIPLDVRPARVDELCASTVEEAGSVFPGRTLRVEGRGAPEVEWDPVRVSQALSNLVVNALRYGASDRPVTVAWECLGREVALRVHNWGPPIAEDLRAHLFEPFRRGPAPGRGGAGGLGLGLFIAREVARAHGGELSVTSSAREGTAFTMRLPRVAPRRD